MTDNILDIRRLRQQAEQECAEAERNLDALRRVEAMLARQRNGHGASGVTPAADKGGNVGHADEPNVGVKARVGEIVRASGTHGVRPRDAVDLIEKEFTFKSRPTAAAAVSSALARFVKKGQVQKRKNGHYVWRDRANATLED